MVTQTNESLPPEETSAAPVAPVAKPKDKKLLAKRYAILIFGVLASATLRAISLHIFVLPNAFASGGVTGIAILIEHFSQIPSGYIIFAINMPLLIASFFLINKRFAIISACGIVLQSGLMILLDYIPNFPVFQGASVGERMLGAIAGGVVCGFGIGLMLKIGGSNGGTDVIATFIYKHFSAANISWFIFMLDSVVVVISFFFYNNDPSSVTGGLTSVLLSFIEMFASAKASELILCGFRGAVKFEIITSSPEKLANELLQKLHRGITSIDVKGAYTGESKTMLICLVRRSQVSLFQKILAKYPDTFAYISSASDVMGRGFKSDVLP